MGGKTDEKTKDDDRRKRKSERKVALGFSCVGMLITPQGSGVDSGAVIHVTGDNIENETLQCIAGESSAGIAYYIA